MTTDLSLKILLSLIEYKTVLPSNFSALFVGNFRGSKDPTPPAITTFGVLNSLPLVVFTIQLTFSFLSS